MRAQKLTLLLLCHACFATLAVAAAAPSNDEQQRIATLLAQLVDDDYKTREQAAKTLFWEGLGALEQLKTAAQSDEDVELRTAARQLVRKIERFLEGGRAVKGLQLALHCDRSTFKVGQEIKLQLELRNNASTSREIQPITLVEYVIPGHEQVGVAEARLVFKRVGDDGKSKVETLEAAPKAAQKKILKPGTSSLYVFQLSRDARVSRGRKPADETLLDAQLELPPGDYEVHAIYFSERLLQDFKDDLQSNTQRITIEPPEAAAR